MNPSAALSGVESDPAPCLAHPSAEVVRLVGRGLGGQDLQRWAHPAHAGQTGLCPREASLCADTAKPGLSRHRAGQEPAGRCRVLGVASGRPGPSRTGPSFPAHGGRRTVCVLRGQAGAGEVLGWSRASGRGWGCLCSNLKESGSDQTDVHTDSRAFLSVSPLRLFWVCLWSRGGWGRLPVSSLWSTLVHLSVRPFLDWP